MNIKFKDSKGKNQVFTDITDFDIFEKKKVRLITGSVYKYFNNGNHYVDNFDEVEIPLLKVMLSQELNEFLDNKTSEKFEIYKKEY